MEYIRQWKVGDQVFGSKAEAKKYEATERLKHMNTADLIANADEAIELLRPFATPRRRKPKQANGPAATAAASGGTPRPGTRRNTQPAA